MLTPRDRSRLHSATLVVASALIALACAVASITRVGLIPPRLERADFRAGGAVNRVMLDLDRSRIADRNADVTYFEQLRIRARVIGSLMATAPVVDRVAHRLGVAPDDIAARAPVTANVPVTMTEPGSEQRAREILLAGRPYQLEIEVQPGAPLIRIYAEAPTPAEAERLATASVSGVRDYLAGVAPPSADSAETAPAVRFVQLGVPHGVPLGGRAGLKVAFLTFLLAFGLAYAALRALTGGLARRRAPATAVDERLPPGEDAWPRTTRALPWLLAAFMALVWLVPFDSVQLNVAFPIDLKLDRLLLPAVAVPWAVAMATGRARAPRLRITWIHAAVGAFVVVAWLSVIVNASALSRTLELDTSLKKLPLLASYVLVFAMTASIVRREEVAPFVKYTLALAVVCAIGMIWEERAFHNLFFDWTQRALPGVFQVAAPASGWDTAGRRIVQGPTAHPLVAAGMLSLALPTAVLGVMHARAPRSRVLYGLAGCVMVIAILGTQRKTGLLAPVAGLLTLAYFRRSELLRLAPVGAVLLVALVIVSPGTLTPVVEQFRPNSLESANGVSDRSSDYDAIRPDVWTHVALGRGFGSYQPVGHRVLDSEMLVRTVETGVVGLAAFVLMALSVVLCARRLAQSRRPGAGAALSGIAAAVTFLVLAMLFDAMGFPQVPYIFMCYAGLVSVLVATPRAPPHDG
jgi:hypothetical protein